MWLLINLDTTHVTRVVKSESYFWMSFSREYFGELDSESQNNFSDSKTLSTKEQKN